jgi:hypothetical protein
MRKWLPVIFNRLCSSQVDIGDKAKLAELKGGAWPWLAFPPIFFCGKIRLGA